MPWQPCVDFSEAMGGGIAEGSPTKSCSSAVVLWMPHSYAASERTFPMGSNVCWQGFVGYSDLFYSNG